MGKIKSKDLINIGIFTLLFMLTTVIAFGITITPIIQFSRMAVSAFLSGPIFMLLITKSKKPFIIIIMGIICSSIIAWIMFGSFYYAVVTFAFFIVAEIISCIGKYKSYKLNQLSYIVCSFWTFGTYGAWWYDTENSYQLAKVSYGSMKGYETFADEILVLITPTSLIATLVSTLIAAILSLLFTHLLFRKHFKKSGLI